MNNLRKVISWVVIILLVFLIGLVINVIFFNPIQSIYNISARSEVVEFTTLDNNLSRYIVYGATIINDTAVLKKHFNGSFQIKENTEVTIQRLGDGVINISLENRNGKTAAKFYDGYSTKLLPFKDSTLYIYIDSIKQKLKEDKHHHFNIEGETRVGKNVYHLNFLENPSMLYSGKISILGRSYWGKDYFEAGKRELHTGDRVVFGLDPKYENAQDTSDAKGIGFVRIDSGSAMNLVYRRKAQDVLIFKPGTKTEQSSYSISMSLIERFMNDKLFKGLSILIGFCVLLMSVLTFIYDTHFYIKEKKAGRNFSTIGISEGIGKLKKRKKKKSKK